MLLNDVVRFIVPFIILLSVIIRPFIVANPFGEEGVGLKLMKFVCC